MRTFTLKINTISSLLGKEEIEKTLPNGRVVKGTDWSPTDLPAAFAAVNQIREEEQLGRNDLVIIDGAAPIWLMTCISHACHPTSVGYNYPQGDCILPVSGAVVAPEGGAEGIEFSVVGGDTTTVEIKLQGETIDAVAACNSLVAPEVVHGKPVKLTGRAPAAVLGALADAFAHIVPYIAVFQPGTGFVVAISHGNVPLGTIVE